MKLVHENPLSCGCSIKGTPYLDNLGNSMSYKDMFIEFCPLHKSAPYLFNSLKEIIDQFPEHPIFPVSIEVVKIAKIAIAKAEGKE